MKKYKKGTKVELFCATHDFQSMESEVIVLDEDCDEEQLESMAKEFFYETKQPEWWFKEVVEVET